MTNWEANQTPLKESTVSHAAHEVEHFLALTAESALYASLQEPIDAVTQLADHVVQPLTGYKLPHLDLVDAPPLAKFRSSDWVAETLGTGIGRAVDLIALGAAFKASGVTDKLSGVVGSKFAAYPTAAKVLTAVAPGALTGAVYGLAFTPTDSKAPFWKSRAVGGLSWTLGAGIGGAVAEGVAISLEAYSQVAGQGFSAIENGGAHAATALMRGAAGGLAKTGTLVVFSGENATEKVLSERIMQGVTRSLISETLQ